MRDTISVKGARENNLKNIDVEIPREKLVVLTGLSGSGKSSLAFEIFCNLVGKQFYDGLREVYPLEIVKAARGPVLIAHGTADEDVPVENARRFHEALTAADIPSEMALIEGADHVFMRHECERELIERSVAWLVRTL